MVSGFLFKSLIHFELIFVYAIRWGPESFCSPLYILRPFAVN